MGFLVVICEQHMSNNIQIGVSDLLGCTHNVLKCSAVCLQLMLVHYLAILVLTITLFDI